MSLANPEELDQWLHPFYAWAGRRSLVDTGAGTYVLIRVRNFFLTPATLGMN
jgi:hypothetical protein